MVTVTKFYCKCCDTYKISLKKLNEHFQTAKHKKKEKEAKEKEDIPDYVLDKLEEQNNKIEQLESTLKGLKIEKVQNLYVNYKILFEKYEKLFKMSKTQNELLLDTIEILKNK
jgi:hypothetical protein